MDEPGITGHAPGDRRAGDPEIVIGRSLVTRPYLLAGHLTDLATLGYQAAELAVETLHCIVGGGLIERHVETVAEICGQFSDRLQYSVHAPSVLDLRDTRHPDLQRQVLMSTVALSAAIGARVLVIHYEARSEDAAIEQGFKDAIARAAELAGQHRLILGIENIEVERSERVLEFLEELHHPWVRMTYDFAHNYLAGDLFGYDHLAAARDCAPYVAHLHSTDNFGRFNQARLGDFNLYRAIPSTHIENLGLGDLHLPLGWGTLPASKLFGIFRDAGYSGLLISEHDYHADGAIDAAEVQALRALVAGSMS